jgi:UDP-3-O-[3-hydroxymyristoyl] glucosamine N-acyltransferase
MLFAGELIDMIKLHEILSFLNVPAKGTNEEQRIHKVLAIDDALFDETAIGWCSDKNKELLQTMKAGHVLVSVDVYKEYNATLPNLILIPVEKPRSAFLKVLQAFFSEKKSFGVIHPSAVIDESVLFDPSQVSIGANVIIERGCKIGNQVTIGPNTVIHAATEIGNACSIGSNNTIGGVGFGYELNEQNEYELMPNIGNVVLKNRVEIGNNVCIDRAVMGSTLLEENVKVDNLVHIAHGVKIGKNSLIIANAMIAGSVEIGENVWISPSVSVRQKLKVENGALVGMGSVVVKNVSENTIVAGNPAKPFEKK